MRGSFLGLDKIDNILYTIGMEEGTTKGREKYGAGKPWPSSMMAASLAGSFLLFQAVHVGLIADGRIGAGKVRAEKIAQVLAWTENGLHV